MREQYADFVFSALGLTALTTVVGIVVWVIAATICHVIDSFNENNPH